MDISQARCTGCGRPMVVTTMVCPSCNVRIESEFEVPALARLSLEDQVFVTAFVRSHGSIKRMEGLFGVSYPTVKNRLNAIAAQLDRSFDAPTPNEVVLDRLARGESYPLEAVFREGGIRSRRWRLEGWAENGPQVLPVRRERARPCQILRGRPVPSSVSRSQALACHRRGGRLRPSPWPFCS